MNLPFLIAAEIPSLVPRLAAGGSLWVLLAVIIGSAIVDWFKKRAAGTDSNGSTAKPTSRPQSAPTQPGSSPAPSPQITSWEEELRRLLGVELPPPKPPIAPPPPIPRLPAERPKPPSPSKAVPAAPARKLAPLARIEPEFAEARRVSTVQLPELRESNMAYQQASRLPDQVSEQLKTVDQQTEQHFVRTQPARADSRPMETMRAVSLLREPRTARQAVIASVILSPPKGLGFE